MPKSKMKEQGLKGVGGRIRKARNDSFLSIKELSEKIGVSFAYLGMIERGERNPSDKMLSSIADITDVSIDWLKDGHDTLDDTVRMDASLFLNIILHEVPDISAKVLAMVLNIDEDELNCVLGETDNYNPMWYTGCSALAERLDIPKLLGKLYEMEAFLKRTEVQRVDHKIIAELSKTLSEVFHDKFEFYSQDDVRSMRYPDIWSFANEPSEPTRDFTFQRKSTRERCRVTLYIPLTGKKYADRLHGVISDALDIHDFNITNIALVFSDRDSFDKSKSIVESKICGQAPKLQLLKNVVVMLIDPASLCITALEKVCLRQTEL